MSSQNEKRLSLLISEVYDLEPKEVRRLLTEADRIKRRDGRFLFVENQSRGRGLEVKRLSYTDHPDLESNHQ